MRNRFLCAVGMAALALAGCGSLEGILQFFEPTTTSVRLVNNAGATVEGTIYYHNQQNIPDELLTTGTFGTDVSFRLAAGADRVVITKSCDDLQAIVIDKAELLLLPGFSPDAVGQVLRDGDDFHCGDEIVFTFTANPDFRISFEVM